MSTNKLIGIALVVVGLVLLYLGYQSSQGLDDQLTEALTGEYTDNTIAYWIAGGVCVALGAILALAGKR